MDKTYNISLGGLAFAIDDAAYRILSRYLKDIRLSLNNSSGVDEIIADVEARMAELLRDRMKSREVVNQFDVEYLIGVMGQPEDFYTEEFLDEETSGTGNTRPYSRDYQGKNGKKLFRDPDNKMLGGVCSGLGHYIGLDATWMRLIVIMLPFLDIIFLGISTSFVIVAYFVLWLVVPEASSTSDKLQMRGEPVNFDSIKDFFGNSPEKVRNNIQDFGNDARRVANQSGSILGNLFRLFVKLIGFFFIAVLLFIAIGLLIAFTAAIVGLGGAFFGVGIAGFSLNEYMPYIFDGQWQQWVSYISLALVMVIPAVALILLVLRLISSRYTVPRYIVFTLPLFWIFGILGLTVVGVSTATQFRSSAQDIKTVNLTSSANTLILQMQDDEMDWDSPDLISVRPGYLAISQDDDVKIKKSETGIPYLEFKYSSKGKTGADAAKNLQHIEYKYQVEDSIVRLDEYLYLKNGSKWRNQEIDITLYLPEGKGVMFKNIDVETYRNGEYDNWVDTNPNNIYTFEGDKLRCSNCQGSQSAVIIANDNDSVSVNNGVITINTDRDSIQINTTENGTDTIGNSADNN